MTRWRVDIAYRTDLGLVEVPHDLNELADLHDLVERGPHWDTIIKIEIVRINHSASPTLTLEAAEKL